MKEIIITLVSLVIIGCATTLPQVNKQDINEQIKSVNMADGANREEAIIIAKNYMVNNGYDFDWNVANPKAIEDTGDHWAITFSPIENGWGSGRRKQSEINLILLLPYFVNISKADGSISVTKFEIKKE